MLRYRHKVLGFLCLLAAITYLDLLGWTATPASRQLWYNRTLDY